MEEDWDLHAVVRGCSGIATSLSPPTTTLSPPSSASNSIFSPFHQTTHNLFSHIQDPFKPRNSSEELHELYKPFFPKSQPLPPPPATGTLSPLPSLSPLSASKPQTHHKHKHSHATTSVSTPRSKRRKNQLKKVCQVPAESLSSDIWAWRKYGQKPIKGSPYPRGYYRCSSSKGCMARKQVERNRSDPGMFIVTYTSEHNHPAPTHRNSLAGSTRQKPVIAQPVESGDPKQPGCSTSPAREDEIPAQAQSTISEGKEEKEDLVEEEEDDDMAGFSDIQNDDFFLGFEELDSPRAGDCFAGDQFPASFGLPWLFNNAATAAGGI